MTILVAGASGATGRRLVEQLLARGQDVRALVRHASRLPEALRAHPRLEVVEGAVLDFDAARLAALVEACSGVASCLGHAPSLRGIFGPPWRLVSDSVRRLCDAIDARGPEQPVRFVLMGSAGVSNRDLVEPVSAGQRVAIALLRGLVPPHADNEAAADVLRRLSGPAFEWAVVRPDSLFDSDEVGVYDARPSPTRSALFDPGRTRRLQVAHFMAGLLTDDALWAQWRGAMPVIYDRPR